MKTLFVVCAALMACAVAQERPIIAVAVLSHDAYIRGTVHFTQSTCGGPVLVEVNIAGLSQAGHGFHIHETGDLSNGCLSLAAHYDPLTRHHGAPADFQRHVGDLGNVFGNANGFANATFADNSISLAGPRNIIGRGVIVHLNIDDLGRGGHHDSLTTGNAGPRVACGVIGYVTVTDPFPCP